MSIRKLFLVFLLALLLVGIVYWGGGYEGSGKNPVSGGSFIEITGLVESPINLTLSELLSMPSKNVTAVLYCVGAPDRPLKNGTWTGVPLKLILQKVNVKGAPSRWRSMPPTATLRTCGLMRL